MYWEPGTYYNLGDVVEFEGHRYKIIQPHTAQSDWSPPVTPALWGRLSDEDHTGEHRHHGHHEEKQQPVYEMPRPEGQTVEIHREEREKHWFDLDDHRKKAFGGGLLAGAALLAGGYAAFKSHQHHEEAQKAHTWALGNWLHDAEARTAEYRNYGPRSPATWILNRGKEIPPEAILVGKEHSWSLFICRAFYEVRAYYSSPPPPCAHSPSNVLQGGVRRWFRLEGSGHPKERVGSRFSFLTEIRAGVTTWVRINPASARLFLLFCRRQWHTSSPSTLPFSLTLEAPVCVNEVQKDLITSTAAISALASFLMGLLANLPVGMAPGLGLNAYFTYSLVGQHGSGMLSYQEALAAVFLEGWIFLILSLLGLRQWLVRLIPQSLVLAVGAGIGVFIAFIGLCTTLCSVNVSTNWHQASSGLSVIGGDPVNFVGLGGCVPDKALQGLPYFCSGGVLRSPTMWLGIFLGGILTVLLMLYRVRGAILIGIVLTSVVSWPRSTPVTYFPHTTDGDALFDYFKQVVSFRRLEKVGNVISYNYREPRVWYALVTLIYVDILDTTGTLYSMAKFAGLRDPVTMDFENSTIAYCVDAFSISIGALLGTSPVTAFIESATGISEGGKTGITAVVTGLCFFISVFFAPIFASIPGWATGGALIIVGSLMIRNVREINWDYVGDAVPAFIVLLMVPLSYNIAYGLIAGILTYLCLNGTTRIITIITRGRIVPPSIEYSEEWSVPPGGLIPVWLRKLTRSASTEEEPAEENGVPLEVREHDPSTEVDQRSEKTEEEEEGSTLETPKSAVP
ncbi:hypothetical protein HMN09_01038900 [Mycena chlorophos]|uniref:Chitin-binding type-3 domain-containing protein n=1 Tax=Mycena chlorophos TaxID=658473 RepID=A0A8H6W057_MYCCL|nr:hypothetical protein HMN09_01038900 [Mycena chlorophos]